MGATGADGAGAGRGPGGEGGAGGGPGGVSIITGSDQKRYSNQSRVNPTGLKYIYIKRYCTHPAGQKRYSWGVISERYGTRYASTFR